MHAQKPNPFIKSFLEKHLLLTLFAALSLISLSIPIQHYIILSRFQHYAISIFFLASGYTLQCLASWKFLRKWGRIAYGFTGIFLYSVAYTFHANPWLDAKIAIQTSRDEITRIYFIIAYLISCLFLGAIWIKWTIETSRQEKHTTYSDE